MLARQDGGSPLDYEALRLDELGDWAKATREVNEEVRAAQNGKP